MPRFHDYSNRFYRYTGHKSPLIEAMRSVIMQAKSFAEIEAISGIGAQTVSNWIDGKVINPQERTSTTVMAAMGYVRADRLRRDGSVEIDYKNVKQIDVEKELERQADWLLRHKKKRRAVTNGRHHGKGHRANGNGYAHHSRAAVHSKSS